MNTAILIGCIVGGGLVLLIVLDRVSNAIERRRASRRRTTRGHRLLVTDLASAEVVLDSLERCGLRGEVHTRPAGFEIVWTGDCPCQ